MIYDNWINIKKYSFSAQWQEIINDIIKMRNSDVTTFTEALTEGKHPLKHGAYISVMSYDTKETQRFENHKQFIDIHFMVHGSERINVLFAHNIICPDHPSTEDAYSAEKDIAFYITEQAPQSTVFIDKDSFAIIFPDELHAPCLFDDRAGLYSKGSAPHVIKAVAKIPIECIR